jgi:ATP-dependent exoDNAse (exonuclease V) beta subunit
MAKQCSEAADAAAREAAVDPRRSFIVQAPAGSGKTELLIQRYLALLATVEEPGRVLAITFTRKAAGEMVDRIVRALRDAQGLEPAEAHRLRTWELGRSVLAQDAKRGWRLLENPAQLRVQTIDAFCAAVVRQLPVTAGLGGAMEVAEDSSPYYAEAARRVMLRLERSDSVSGPLSRLLGHLDNDVEKVQRLLVAMLGSRDQWLRHMPPDGDIEKHRKTLEESLRQVVLRHLQMIAALFPEEQRQAALRVLGYAAQNLFDYYPGAEDEDDAIHDPESPSLYLSDLRIFGEPDPAHLNTWLFMADTLLNDHGEWRSPSGLRADRGFPPVSAAQSAGEKAYMKKMKEQAGELLEALAEVPGLDSLLHQIRLLPPVAYTDEQWAILSALFAVLPAARDALLGVFTEAGAVDFTEIATRARTALSSPAAGSLLEGVQHVLVDEFQDTSFSQYDLLGLLTQRWAKVAGGRTVFAVGDPMQSIYRFREAEVGLFLSAVRDKVLGGVALSDALRLRRNFRSLGGLIDWFNETFDTIMTPAGGDDPRTGAVSFCPSECGSGAEGGAVAIHPVVVQRTADAAQPEAEIVADIVEHARRRHEEATARDGRPRTTAILVRTRGCLPHILCALRRRGIKYMAVKIDALAERTAVQDLWALTRALVHPADRIAWLSVLRAPWCGLTLADLHALAGNDEGVAEWPTIWEAVSDPAAVSRMTEDGQARLERIRPVLEAARTAAGRCSSLRDLVERTWLALGGPACGLTPTQMEEVNEYLDLLEARETGGDLSDFAAFEEAMASLYAPPAADADESLQIMTIHQAKGLEFDTVILPALGRGTRIGGKQLLRWAEFEWPDRDGRVLMLAPIEATGEDRSKAAQYLADLEKQKDTNESLRLLYVACTRAREELHLVGHTSWRYDNKAGHVVLKNPWHNSFLRHLWPLVKEEYEHHFASQARPLTREIEAAAEAAAQAKDAVTPCERKSTVLQRLTSDWAAPEPGRTIEAAGGVITGASPSASHEDDDGIYLRHAAPEMKHAGTVVHAFLERMGSEGLERWDERRIRAAEPEIAAALRRLGVVDPEKQAAAVQRVVSALRATITDPKARWLFDPANTDIRNEWPVTGIVGGRVVSGVIDRTFMAPGGVRWVVDYKTSSHEGSERAQFVQKKIEFYRGQLDDYAVLLAPLLGCETSAIRRALYFPMLGHIERW